MNLRAHRLRKTSRTQLTREALRRERGGDRSKVSVRSNWPTERFGGPPALLLLEGLELGERLQGLPKAHQEVGGRNDSFRQPLDVHPRYAEAKHSGRSFPH